MIKIPPIPFIRRRRYRGKAPATAPILTSAAIVNYEPPQLALGFDRAIDVSAIVLSQFIVDDPAGTGFRYTIDGVISQPTPNAVLLSMWKDGSAHGTLDVLNVGPDNGIVAVVGGVEWGGAVDVGLPFG